MASARVVCTVTWVVMGVQLLSLTLAFFVTDSARSLIYTLSLHTLFRSAELKLRMPAGTVAVAGTATLLGSELSRVAPSPEVGAGGARVRVVSVRCMPTPRAPMLTLEIAGGLTVTVVEALLLTLPGAETV